MRSLFRLPRDAGPATAELEITPSGDGERWARRIGSWRMVSREDAAGPLLRETAGPLELRFRLEREGEALRYRQVGQRLGLARIGVPLPRWALVVVDAVERPSTRLDGTHLDVRFRVAGGLLFAYHGDLEVRR